MLRRSDPRPSARRASQEFSCDFQTYRDDVDDDKVRLATLTVDELRKHLRKSWRRMQLKEGGYSRLFTAEWRRIWPLRSRTALTRLQKVIGHWARGAKTDTGRRVSIERLLTGVSWLLPRRQREVILGDLLEDIVELRNTGCGRWRLRLFVCWQLGVAVAHRCAGPCAWLVKLIVKVVSW